MICCFPRGRETERERSCFPLKHVKIDTRLEMSTRAIFIRGTFFRPGRVSASTASAEDVHGSDSPGAPAKPLKKTWSFFKLGAWQGSSRLRSSSLKGGIPPWAKACSFYGVLQCLFPSSGPASAIFRLYIPDDLHCPANPVGPANLLRRPGHTSRLTSHPPARGLRIVLYQDPLGRLQACRGTSLSRSSMAVPCKSPSTRSEMF